MQPVESIVKDRCRGELECPDPQAYKTDLLVSQGFTLELEIGAKDFSRGFNVAGCILF